MTVDFKTTPIGCPDCRVNGRPKGYKLNTFTGNLDPCRTCDTTEQIFVCDSFSFTGSSVLRSTKCNNCHATKGQHLMVAQYMEMVSAD